MNIERRSLLLDQNEDGTLLRIESRCDCGGVPDEECDCKDKPQEKREWIVGYAAKFGVLSLNLGDFQERIAPSAFGLVTERRGRRKPLETRALWNHDANMPLAKYPKTLRLRVDDVGLRYEFPVPRSTYGQDLASNIRDGIVTGSSFSFTVAKNGEEWSIEEGRSIRTVTRVDSLIDVGPVCFAAYPDADCAVARRAFDAFRRRRVVVPVGDAYSVLAREKAREIRGILKKYGR